MTIKSTFSPAAHTFGHITDIYIYICLPDRNYVQEDSCLPDQDRIHEDLADTVPLTHDDLGCPIRRDRLYHQDNTGATAKPLSGPPVSPSLFRSTGASAPERPSPKAIQASIKESATLAAAISMQWKEEVSAMRRELAELRRDLCKELRAFNSNFNTFTQHYNTWSPQGGNMAAGAGAGLGAGAGPSTGTGTRAWPGAGAGSGPGPGPGAGRFGTSTADRGAGGAREKKPQISKVSVGTQARSKVLVRQSTADAAVNCPEEKDEKKGARRGLPKQLSMDPSILASPQSMYVESAIPLSLDPILPVSVRAVKPETLDVTAVLTRAESELAVDGAVLSSSDMATNEPTLTTHGTAPLSLETAPESPQGSSTPEQEMIITPQQTDVGPRNNSLPQSEPSFTDNTNPPDSKQIHKDTIQLPYPVPVVTVSPPDEQDYDIVSDSESPDVVTVDKPDSGPQDPTAVSSTYSALENTDSSDPTQEELQPSESPVSISQGSTSVCDAPTPQFDPVTLSDLDSGITCPSIVVSEYLDSDDPASPPGSVTDPDPIITFPDHPSDLPDEEKTSVSTFASSSVETPPNPESQESQDSDWPPLPEPLDTTTIYHADLVHFDLVMLTSLDQDDLDSVFMDPEPEPFDISVDSLSNVEDLDPPMYQSDSPSSPLPSVDPAAMGPLDPSESTEFVCLDPAMEYHMSQDVASGLHDILPQVTVTISPPSSVSPDTSLELDFGPTSPASEPVLSSSPDLQEITSEDLLSMESDDVTAEILECVAVSHMAVGPVEEDVPGSPEAASSEQAFLWYRWQKRGHRRDSMYRSASVELWSGRYEYNSAEITYVSLTL